MPNASDSLEELKRLESELDASVQSLALTGLPLRAPLAFLHGALDRFAYGDRLTGGPPAVGVAEAMLGRLFGVWAALERCPVELGGTYREALEGLRRVDDGSQMMLLMGYGHLCELMPEVHEGLWTAAGDRAGGFVLDHASPDIARYETLDWLLLELGSPILVGPVYLKPSVAADVARRLELPHVACDGLRDEGAERRRDYVRLMEEPPLLARNGFEEAIGLTRNEFRRVQAALFALADIQLSLGNAHYAVRLRPGYVDENDDAGWRAMEYASAAWPWELFLDWVADVAAVSKERTDRALAYFVLVPGTNDRMIGEGYWPPLTRIDDDVLVSPVLLRTMLLERNMLYVINRTDRDRFDRVVSDHLEPQLLDDAAELLSRASGLVIEREIAFPGGEIDLLAYDPTTNIALHVQAKAALPPQGARMTRQVGSRASEALRQLQALRQLDEKQRDKILSKALGLTVDAATIQDALLTRSCFGRASVWSNAKGVALVNPGSLGILVSRSLHAGTTLDLRTLAGDALALLDEIAQTSRTAWTRKDVAVGADHLEVPMLDSDPGVIASWRIRAAAARLGRHDLACAALAPGSSA